MIGQSSARRRPFMVWGALVLFISFGVIGAFFSVLIFFGSIRDDQVHEGSVPGGLWVLFVALAVSAVFDLVWGVLIFRGIRWAWITAVVLAALGIAVGVAAIAMSSGGGSFTSLIPDIATLGVLLNRDVREWCSGRAVADADGRRWYPGSAR